MSRSTGRGDKRSLLRISGALWFCPLVPRTLRKRTAPILACAEHYSSQGVSTERGCASFHHSRPSLASRSGHQRSQSSKYCDSANCYSTSLPLHTGMAFASLVPRRGLRAGNHPLIREPPSDPLTSLSFFLGTKKQRRQRGISLPFNSSRSDL